jgi:hypothetical protein
MNASKLLKVTLLMISAFLSQSVFASVGVLTPATAGSGNISSSFSRSYQESLLHVNKLLSYVNLAYIATDMGMYDRAASDIRDAQAIASNLEIDSPTFVSEARLNYGKLTYDIKGEEVSYYVPEINNAFVVPDYDHFLQSKNISGVVERNAHTVSASLEIDLRHTSKLLSTAFNDLKHERYNSARVELAELHQNALIAESAVKRPAQSVHDNLRLTQALINSKQYKSAQYSLEQAREQLDAFKQNTLGQADSKTLLKLDTQIITMEMRLKGTSPLKVQKAERRIGQWINTVDGWMSEAGKKIS